MLIRPPLALQGHDPIAFFHRRLLVIALRCRFVHMLQQSYAQCSPSGLVTCAQPAAGVPMCNHSWFRTCLR